MINAPDRHEEIERETGLTATVQHRRGELGLDGSPLPNDVWMIRSPLLSECSLSDHLLWIDGQVRPHFGYFRSLVDAGVEVDLYCGYQSDCDHCGFELVPEALALAHDLGVRLGVGVIVT